MSSKERFGYILALARGEGSPHQWPSTARFISARPAACLPRSTPARGIVGGVAAGRPIFGSADHFVYAVDRTTGKELWKHDTGEAVEAPPLAAGERVFIGNRGRGLYALKLVG